jgi:hypothetical protein
MPSHARILAAAHRSIRDSIREVRKQVCPQVGMSRSALGYVVDLMEWTIVSFASHVDMDLRCKPNLSASDHQVLLLGHLRHIMSGALLMYAQSDSRLALELAKRCDEGDSSQEMRFLFADKYVRIPAVCSAADAGLLFDPNAAILHCWLGHRLPVESIHFAVIIASVTEYVTSEILELSGHIALRRASLIEINDVKAAIRGDSELQSMYLLFNAARGDSSIADKIPELDSSSSECSDGEDDPELMRAQIKEMNSKLENLEEQNAFNDKKIHSLQTTCREWKDYADELSLKRGALRCKYNDLKEKHVQLRAEYVHQEGLGDVCFKLSSELKDLKKNYASLQRRLNQCCDELRYERADKLKADQARMQLQQDQEQPQSTFLSLMKSDLGMRTKHALIAMLDDVGQFLRPYIVDFFVRRHEELLKEPNLSWPDEIERLKRKDRKGSKSQTLDRSDFEKLSGGKGAWELARVVGLQESHAFKYDGFDTLDIAGIVQLMLCCNGLVESKAIRSAHELRLLRNHLSHKASDQKLPCNVHDIRRFLERLCQNALARYEHIESCSASAHITRAFELLTEVEHMTQPQHEDAEQIVCSVCSVHWCHSDSDRGSCSGSDCDDFD